MSLCGSQKCPGLQVLPNPNIVDNVNGLTVKWEDGLWSHQIFHRSAPYNEGTVQQTRVNCLMLSNLLIHLQQSSMLQLQTTRQSISIVFWWNKHWNPFICICNFKNCLWLTWIMEGRKWSGEEKIEVGWAVKGIARTCCSSWHGIIAPGHILFNQR